MAFPKRHEIKAALLKALFDLGGEARPQATYSLLARKFPQITSMDLEERSKTGNNVWWNKVQWAKNELKDEGCIEGTPTGKGGVWKITSKGI